MLKEEEDERFEDLPLHEESKTPELKPVTTPQGEIENIVDFSLQDLSPTGYDKRPTTEDQQKPKPLFQKLNTYNHERQCVELQVPDEVPLVLRGDILIRLKSKGSLKSNLICRLSFNTSFVQDRSLGFTIREVDPCRLKKDPKTQGFQVDIITEEFCKDCTPDMEGRELCTECSREMSYELKHW